MTDKCFACGAPSTEDCRRPAIQYCGREHEGKKRTAVSLTKIDELKDRFIEMVASGCTRFGWTVGPKWQSMSLEERAAAILEMWDAPRVASGPPRSGREPIDISELVAKLSHVEKFLS